MKVPTPRYLRADDLKGAPEWAKKLLSNTTNAFERLVEPLQSKISAKDNLNAELLVIDVEHLVEVRFRLRTLNGRAQDLWVTRVLTPAGSLTPSFAWREDPSDSRLIFLTCSFPAGAGTYKIRVRVEGD